MHDRKAAVTGAASARTLAELNASAAERFAAVRSQSLKLAAPLTPEDACAQSMPACSPVKWHLAHTTWFFEMLVLEAAVPGFEPVDERFRCLFNSYYNALGKQFPKELRGTQTRPTFDEVLEYRRRVDDAMQRLLSRGDIGEELLGVIATGINHEQQHQELILSDIKHLFSLSPLAPAYVEDPTKTAGAPRDVAWHAFDEGIRWIGAAENKADVYDNEFPRHRVFLEPFEIADRCVTNGEWMAFIEDGGYRRSELWLDAGWTAVQTHGWSKPFYWRHRDGAWHEFTLSGERALDPAEPVVHVSFFEADAFARWAGARLPTEHEWETAAVEGEASMEGNFVEAGGLHPRSSGTGDGLRQMFGDVWEWTRSDYGPYPGYTPPPGALGEYNGKFMCGQYVLRGGCCATPRSHIRRTYRNFYQPGDRWCFSGLRLARSLS